MFMGVAVVLPVLLVRLSEARVDIYFGGEPIAYLAYDHDDRVEHVFVGGS